MHPSADFVLWCVLAVIQLISLGVGVWGFRDTYTHEEWLLSLPDYDFVPDGIRKTKRFRLGFVMREAQRLL